MDFDDLIKGVQRQSQGGQTQSQGDEPDHAHVNALAGPLGDMLGGGGITDILGKLTGGGFGDTVKSWIGTGANLPISADSLTSILGSGFLGSLAAKVGLTHDQTSGVMAKILPGLIDQLTPGGHAPAVGAAAPSASSITDLIAKMTGK